MADWAPVEHDPFATAPPRLSLTERPGAPPPPAKADAPLGPSGTNWAPVDHTPDFAPVKDYQKDVPEDQPGFWESAKSSAETFATDLHNQRAAASQGTTPNVAAHRENLVSDNVVEGDDGNLHYIDDEGKLHPTDTNKHVVLRDPSDRKLKVFARTEDTDEGRLSSAGRLMMTGMATETPRFGTAAPAAGIRTLGIGQRSAAPAVHPAWLPGSSTSASIEAADRLGIKLPKAIASDSHNVNLLGQAFTKAPGGGSLREAIEQGVQGEEGLAGALARTGAQTGGVADAKMAGEGVTTGLEQGFKPQTQQLVSQLYNSVDKLVDPKAKVPLTNTQRAVAEILAKKQSYNNDDIGPAVGTVAGALKRPGGLTYAAIKDLRSSVGEMVDNKFLPPDISQKELSAIYGALSEDLGNAATVAGGSRARAAWEVANNASKQRFDAIETLNKVVGSKTRSDEDVMSALHRMARTGAGADIDTLTATRKALSGTPGAWENVASTVIGRLGKNSQGEFSPNLFVRDYGDLSPAAKRMLFHAVGKGDVVGALDDIAAVSKKYVDAGKLANTSGTAGSHATLGAVVGGMTALFSGDVVTPIKILGGVLGSNVTARLLGGPATVKSVARWTRAVDALAQAPTARSIAAYNIASRNLGNTTAAAAGDPSIAPNLIQKLQGAVRRPDERQEQ